MVWVSGGRDAECSGMNYSEGSGSFRSRYWTKEGGETSGKTKSL